MIANHIKFLALLFSIQISSQNLVLNPSFEQTNRCIDAIGDFGNNIHHWSTPTSGTTDFFNACTHGKVGVPTNYQGVQKAKFGKNYAGFGMSRGWSMEYIQGELSEKLIKGEKYKIAFYINLADESNYAVNRFDFLFTDQKIKINSLDMLSEHLLKKINIKEYSFHSIESDIFFKDKTKWRKVTTEFIATGNEQFLILGDFAKYFGNKKLKISKKKMKLKKQVLSYYYIDMVSIERVHESEEKVAEAPKTSLKEKNIREIILNKEYRFQNVFFLFNNSDLSEHAKNEINAVYNFLNKNLKTKILISGYTDNVGDAEFNKTLSEKRAKSVTDYFIALGLDKQRISFVGFGNKKPIASNETEEGRKKNRRVEFKILEQN